MLDALAAAVKALLYVGFLSGVGAVFAAFTLREATPDSAYAERVTRRGLWLGVAACLAGALILLLRLGGQFDNATLSTVFASSVGAAVLMQLTGAALVLAMPDDRDSRFIRLGSAALVVLAFGFNGHAASAGPFEGIFAFVHTSIAAWWIGSLWILRHACVAHRSAELAKLVRRFGALAARMIGVLAISGLLLIYALVRFETLPALSPYENNLARKLLLVAVVLALAAYNRFRLTPRLLGGNPKTKTSLRKIVEVELVLIGLILIATAVTTTYTSPHA